MSAAQAVDIFGRPVERAPVLPSLLNPLDPLVKTLQAKFKYISPVNQSHAGDEGGPGFDFTKGKFGSFDLGNKLVLAPKRDERYENIVDEEGRPTAGGLLGLLNSSKPAALNPDGSMNPDGWEVRSTKSQAMGGIIGTLGVLGAAFGASYFTEASAATSTGAGLTSGGSVSADLLGNGLTITGNGVGTGLSFPGAGIAAPGFAGADSLGSGLIAPAGNGLLSTAGGSAVKVIDYIRNFNTANSLVKIFNPKTGQSLNVPEGTIMPTGFQTADAGAANLSTFSKYLPLLLIGGAVLLVASK